MPLIPSELGQSVGTITLDNPAKRNALCATLVGELIAALAGFELEKARAVVMRAAPGVTIWSSGHDVNELPKGRRDPLGWDDLLRHLVRRVRPSPPP
jgi:methylmalonyl-CoA decarboxylase